MIKLLQLLGLKNKETLKLNKSESFVLGNIGRGRSFISIIDFKRHILK
jgi:hypothetical protein